MWGKLRIDSLACFQNKMARIIRSAIAIRGTGEASMDNFQSRIYLDYNDKIILFNHPETLVLRNWYIS